MKMMIMIMIRIIKMIMMMISRIIMKIKGRTKLISIHSLFNNSGNPHKNQHKMIIQRKADQEKAKKIIAYPK